MLNFGETELTMSSVGVVNDIAATQEEKLDFRFDLPVLGANCAFFFDIDGTLSDIQKTPDRAFIPKTTLSNLIALQKKMPIALISGRSLASIDGMIMPLMLPAAGQHGLEIRFSDGDVVSFAPKEPIMEEIAERVRDFTIIYPELVVEYKGMSVAVHYRQNPMLGGMVWKFLAGLAIERETILGLQRGKLVTEIKFRGANKGTAIHAFMQRPEYAGRTPVFFGDDETDEDAHKAVNGLNGHSVQIGVSSRNAQYRLSSPRELRQWLNNVTNILAGNK